MTVYSAFVPSSLGMMSQSHALTTIGVNVANVTTGGYRKTETRFATVLSRSLFNQSDLGGVTPKDYQRIDDQGLIMPSSSATDLAISGRGFFILNTAVDGSGTTLYTRDGSFQMVTNGTTTATADDGSTITVKRGYLADKNGYFVQGLTPDANGDFSVTDTLGSLRVDQFAFATAGQATTTATLRLNLPAGDDAGDQHRYNIDLYDSNGDQQTASLDFTKGTTPNRWTVTTTTSQTAVAQVDTVTLAGTVEAGDSYSVTVNGNVVTYNVTGAEADINAVRDALVAAINADATVGAVVTAAAGGAGALTLTADTAGTAFTGSAAAVNGGGVADNTATASTTTANAGTTTTSAATTLTFDSKGAITNPTSLTLALTFAGGGSASIALDISGVTQFDGDFTPFSYSKDGFGKANLRSFSFDELGHLVGSFDNATNRELYLLPLAEFANPNALEMKNGNVFAQTEDSGDRSVVAAGSTGFALFTPYAHELSNVDIADEFTRMIMTQHAYSASATVFRTVDEMTVVARDLKR